MIDATPTNAADVAVHRVSPLRLGDPGPSEEALERIVAAGLRAPDHGQLRPWKFLLIHSNARTRFGELLAQSLHRRNPQAPEETIQVERAKPMRAPLIIVAAAALRASSKVPHVEQIASTGAAIQNMLLAAHGLGYGGFWRTGAPAYDRELIRALGLAENDQIVGFVYVGTIITPGKAKHPDPTNVVREWTGSAESIA